MKNYREIKIRLGSTIETALEEMSKHRDLVCIKFNGKVLYSDTDNLETAYKKITGLSKDEFDKKCLRILKIN